MVMLNRKSGRAEEAEKKVLEEAPGSKAPGRTARAGQFPEDFFEGDLNFQLLDGENL